MQCRYGYSLATMKLREEGLSKREIIRCLKRYVAREVYSCLQEVDRL